MSESKEIADHEDALGIYFDEMLLEASVDTLNNKAPSNTIKQTRKHHDTASFRALLFDINGLQLAIGTHEVKAILPWPEAPLEQNQDTDGNKIIMGYYNQSVTQIKIVNTAHIVLPIKHQHDIAKPCFIIVVGTGKWALSCHKINTVINISTEDIRWCESIGARPWLAGTSIEKSCGIINIAELEKLLY